MLHAPAAIIAPDVIQEHIFLKRRPAHQARLILHNLRKLLRQARVVSNIPMHNHANRPSGRLKIDLLEAANLHGRVHEGVVIRRNVLCRSNAFASRPRGGFALGNSTAMCHPSGTDAKPTCVSSARRSGT